MPQQIKMNNQENQNVKDYLLTENTRNRKFNQLFSDILRCAFGRDDSTLIAHHLTFDNAGEPDEIPSADCLIFDHFIMSKVFADDYKSILSDLAKLDVEKRDRKLGEIFYNRYPDLVHGQTF